MKKQLPAFIVLGLVAIVAALCLATVNGLTKDVIAGNAAREAEESRLALIPGAVFEQVELPEGSPALSLFVGRRDGEPVGYVATVEAAGYAGAIQITVGTEPDGTLTGIVVGGEKFSETPGLGAKAKEAKFTEQFRGKTAPLAIGDQVDAITAATITSGAVVRGVNTAVDVIGGVAGFQLAGGPEGGALADGRYAASATGFAGPVYVEIQLDDAGVITEIIIGDENFAETAGFGLRAQEPAFYEQFIGKSGSVALGVDVDALTGATITSQAVVDAVNAALLIARDPDAAEAIAAVEEEPFVMPEIPEDAVVSSAATDGFAGPVEAQITVDPEEGTLLNIELGGDAWAETQGFGARALEPAFWQQFIGKSLPIAEEEIDLLTGATVTSKAVIAAVNMAYEALAGEEPAETAEETAVLPEEVVEIAEEAVGDTRTAEASEKGFEGPVAAKITVDEENKIVSVEFGGDTFAETKGIGSKVLEPEFAEQFVGKTLPIEDGDVDLITGATISSKAAVAAVNKAFESLAVEEVVETAEEADSNTRTAEASEKGFEGPVAAKITIDESNKIVGVEFGDDAFAETKGFGAKVLEPEFADQFLGKTLPIEDGDVDLITGATISSKAAVAAVNKAFESLAAEKAVETPEEAVEAAEESDIPTRTAEASEKGFEGPVAAKITVDESNKIVGVEFGDDAFAETKGFGSKVLEPEFADQFIRKTLPIEDGDVDLISGATISSKAAIAAVNKAFESLAEEEVAETAEEAVETPEEAVEAAEEADIPTRTAEASEKGFEGPVAAKITIDESNKIVGVEFGDDEFAETKGFGAKVLEPEFADQFLGKTLPIEDGDVDLITGATISSKAAVAAVNKAFESLAVEEAVETPEEVVEVPEEAVEAAEEADIPTRTAEASEKGFEGPVAAKITIDESNKIVAVEFGDDEFAETKGFGAKVLEPEFADQFIGKTLPIEDGDVDLITGATISSKAAIAAVNKAFESLAAEEAIAPPPPITESARIRGFAGPVFVEITADEQGTITGITIGDEKFAETKGFGAKALEPEFAEQFIGKTLPVAMEDIDAISGATVTTQAVVRAVNAAYQKLVMNEILLPAQ